MTPAQLLQGKAIELIAHVLAGNRIEGSLVEAKSIWPDPDKTKTAWQLGALANAALGEPVVLLVGLDEDGHCVADGLEEVEPSEWWAKLQSRFDGVSPILTLHIRVPVPDEGVVWALQFVTDQGPYVVKRREDDSFIERGVPWREATSTRPATQYDLNRALLPTSKLPYIEATWAQAKVGTDSTDGGIVATCGVEMRLAVLPSVPPSTSLLLQGRSTLSVTLLCGSPNGYGEIVQLEAEPRFQVLPGSSGITAVQGGGLTVAGAGLLHVTGNGESESMGPARSPGDIPMFTTAVRIEAILDGAGLARPIRLSALADIEDDRGNPAYKFLTWGKA